MSAVDDNTKQRDQEQPTKEGSFGVVNRPENERRVAIGFIPYRLESPAHVAGFPRNILFVKKAKRRTERTLNTLLLPDSFVQDEETKRMAYYRRESSPYR